MSYSIVEGNLEPDMILDVATSTDYDLDDAVSVELIWKTPNGEISTVSLTEVSTDGDVGVYKRVWVAGDTDQVGVHRGRVLITWDVDDEEETETIPSDGTWNIWYVHSAT